MRLSPSPSPNPNPEDPHQMSGEIDQIFDRMADRCTRLGRENAILRARFLTDQSETSRILSASERAALCDAYALLADSTASDETIDALDKVICFFGGRP
jgi:hypothetical protein